MAWICLLLMLSGDIKPNPSPGVIKGILLNARSIKSLNSRRNKLAELQSLVTLKSAAIVCLTETWLSDDISNDDILPSDHYNIYRKDLGGNGGILTAIHTSVNSRSRPDLTPPTEIHNEILVVKIRFPKVPKLALINFYRPPSDTSLECVANLQATLRAVADAGFVNICVTGDFNLPNLNPIAGVALDNRWNCSEYCDIFHEAGLSHFVTQPTHELGNTLDFILVTCPEFFTEISVEQDLFPSDHYVINFGIISDLHKSQKTTRTIYNYHKANWSGLKQAIIDSNGHVNKFIPKYKLKIINNPPWIDGDVIHLSHQKEAAHNKALRSYTPQSWAKYKKLRNKLRNFVNSKYHNYIKDCSDNIASNPKRFWSLLRAKTKHRSILKKVHLDNRSAQKPIRKAFLFNSFFESNFTKHDSESQLPPAINDFVNPNLSSCTISIAETRIILDNIDTNKATGPDDISGRILRECSKEIAPSSTCLFNMSLSLGKMPENWKLANITPVLKKGDKGQCENYRPISLLCMVSKVFEHVIMNQIKNEITPLITPFQYGFLNGKSTETQLLHVYSFINDILDISGRVDIIYLDFTKAFDSVPHHFPLHKLKSFGINGVLYEWFCSYLTGRKQCVIIEGDLSDWCDVASGVPQGSILGPLLFLMYINDMVEELSESTNIALFADDAKIYSKIKSSNDHQALQRNLSKLEDWSNLWKLKFNSNKCKVLRRVLKHDSVYRMNDEILENVTSFNDLGVLIIKDLDWQAHIHKKSAKQILYLLLSKEHMGIQPL